ncbi:unnamed protein product [Brachionus calyciflorus]|uniref:G-protein coupled receptors family 1 profile domain-containing protein n=1 Tax=Brachionus calyciflorus TaxID=104777 RepID=A0A814E9J8_9BILA|nr:unnamed protein product [Brachionus calyciflorus]
MTKYSIALFIIAFLFYSNAEKNKYHLLENFTNNKSLRCREMNHYFSINIIQFYGQFLEIKLKYFNYFNQFSLECFSNSILSISSITLIPNYPLTLDNNLNLTFETPNNMFINLYFVYIKNIDSNVNIFDNLIRSNYTKINVDFYYSSLEFSISPDLNKTQAIFKNLTDLKFSITCKYNENSSPLLFYKSTINELILSGLSDTLIKKNLLGFERVDNFDIESSIKIANFDFYKIIINRKMLYFQVFRNVRDIYLNGQLKFIYEKSFSNFEKLRLLNINTNRDFKFISENLKFLNFLNSNLSLSVDNTITIYFSFYEFPNEDICLFREFPRNRFLSLSPDYYGTQCTCLNFWLFNNYYNSEGIKLIKDYCSNPEDMDTCNFTFLIRNCDFKLYEAKKTEKSLSDYFYDSELLNLIVSTLTPFVCILGLITNLINIKILKYDMKIFAKQKEVHIMMYQFMFYNSIINFFYCIIYIFHLLNVCISINGVFCLFISRSEIVQYYEIVIVDFLGGILKVLSNILNVSISINRYTTLEKNSFFSKLRVNGLYKKLMILLITIFVFLVNIDRLLTSFINNDSIINDNYIAYFEFPIKNTFTGLFDSEAVPIARSYLARAKNPLYFAIFCINFVVNDFFLFFALTFVDVLLLLKFKSNMSSKNRFFGKKNIGVRIKKNDEKNLRITTTIIVNWILIPEKTCMKCNRKCSLKKRSNVPEKFAWRCTNSTKFYSVKDGSFFQKFKLPILTVLEVITSKTIKLCPIINILIIGQKREVKITYLRV